MKNWDALIVGAGPAGCAAAYDLVTSGKHVLLLDRCDFPRVKACAGGLTIKAVRALRYSIEPVIRERTRHIRVSKNLAHDTVLKSSQPICIMTVRQELDEYCLQQTIAAGAEFLRIGPIQAISESDDGVVLSTTDEEFHGRFLIGADGANSRVRQLTSRADWFERGFALETNVSIQPESSDMHLDFGVLCDGYGWVFPKGDHLNVGLGSLANQHKITRDSLAAYVLQKLGVEMAGPVVGQYLGGGGTVDHGSARSIFLVGDAGGLVDPLTGEGIYNAIVSGQAAARAINAELDTKACAAQIFSEALAEIRNDLALSTRGARSFYGNIDRGYSVLTLPLVRHFALKTYLTGLSFTRALKRYPFLEAYLSSRLNPPTRTTATA